ncbi:MAG TPA: sigma-70 family RNA polymerase sigma factor [Anaerohalosphaeraceae bacterium]|nr:sigma-70 family RNA polymerase sigma factor [Anaerohalosphaeraceae bacterium]HOL89878.1 sigma-70 family RNA polymerase sigma factor [Anaerohalosphaeraceae bacterium]HPP56813.1 sigma-70 family RNA polymerase sigma factor [Anaerohalosphaeraceae bacterium]
MMDQEVYKRNKLFLKLLLENQPKIHAYILSLVTSQSDADDILQEVCSQIWARFDQFEEGGNFLSWALRFAFFEVLNFRSKKNKSRQVLFDNEVLQQMIPVLDEEMKTADARMDALEQCLEKLNERSRKMIDMRYDKGLNPAQISRSMNLSIHAVYKLLSRIHSQLLSCVERAIRREEFLHG